ncbi:MULTISPECIES: DUF4383 domain-containing protein [Arthrobacter]|jgi:hypothetical protein|uniref:DUF4383 domain-containing protein n=1 Tax=Arthrobacter sp. UNC362MFTsu5.1 TaxID=1449044 RepID=UPI0004839FDE|nr:DUF4383 domain-containing protein [Arthrobacter sp. UNC362MFTsu5.1]
MKSSEAARARFGLRKNVQKSSLLAGAAVFVLGVLGFIPGVTANYGTLAFAGHGSEAMLLGVFQVSVLHNLIHLLSGVAGVLMSRRPLPARNFLIGAGVTYMVLWSVGQFLALDSPVNILPVNSADNWLHLFLGMALIGFGVAFSRDAPARLRESRA